MRGVHALVAEVAVHLEDAVHAADDRALEVDFRGDAQVEVHVERVHVRGERPGGGAPVDDLQHRCLQLDVAAPVEVLADGAVDGGAHADHVAGGGAGDEVEFAPADALVLRQGDLLAVLRGPGLGQGAQRLRGDGPRGVGGGQRGGRGVVGGPRLLGGLGRGREDRQLAAARGDDAPVDEEVVPQVHVVLVGGQRVGADGGGGEHHLDLLARAVHEGREAELAAIAHQDDAPGDAHEVLGLLARLQMGVPLADLRYRGGDRQRDGVGGGALLHEAGALLRADLDLFGGVVRGGVHVLGVCFTHAPIVPGAGAPGRPQPRSAANRTRFAAHSPVRAAESDQGNAR